MCSHTTIASCPPRPRPCKTSHIVRRQKGDLSSAGVGIPTAPPVSEWHVRNGGSFGSRLLHGCGNGGVPKEDFPPSARVFDCIMCQAGHSSACRDFLWLMQTSVE